MAAHSSSVPSVELGFVEESNDPEDFSSSVFPSKVGGKPVWLDPVRLPSPSEVSCKECTKPCVLLFQVYAPHSDDPASYHRTLYVFMCADSKCSKPNSTKPFRVFRCQLPRNNPYYDNDSDHEDNLVAETDGYSRADSHTPLCSVCGSHGPSRCGQCMSVHYCSQYHQTYHWKNGHKMVCKDMKAGKTMSSDIDMVPLSSILIPELLIITETEPESKTKESKKTDEDRLQEYEQFVTSDLYRESCRRNPGLSEQLNGCESDDNKPDKMFENFKKRVDREPEQVLRFQPGGEPLLISQNNPPVPPLCENCGASRQFELQVMPQLLYYTKIDSTSTTTGTTTGTLAPSIDWGTLLIYTCTSHCTDMSGYREEFLWKQDVL